MESHPTTIPPPLPENSPPSPSSPPPQNPHTPPDASDFDCFQKGESSSSRNKENLKSLVLKLAGRMFPAHQSLIGRRFDDIFPDELLVPDHPPYADMILTAIWELKAEGSSSEEAISDYIKNEYHELPWAHDTILNHHLKDLCIKGKITMTQDKCYSRCSSITKPKPKPVTIHSPCSSSSASLCSSPSSSSTSFCWDPPHKTRKRKTNRKNTMGRRGRGRGRGGPRGMIRVRKRGVLLNRNAIKIGEESKQATEDQNGVEETEDETKVMIGQKVNGNVKEKGESVGLRRSERRKKDVNEGNVACEQKRKHYNVVWIGRGVRKLNDQYDDDNDDDDVIKVEDDVMIDNDDEVVEQLEQKEEERETNVEQNQLVENQQSEKQNDDDDDDDDTVKEQIIPEEVKQPKKYSLRSCVKNRVENEKVELVEEQATEANQKGIVLASSTMQQNLEIDKNETNNESQDEQLELHKEVKVVEDEDKQEEEQNEGVFNGQPESLTTQDDDDTVKEQIMIEEVKQPKKYSLRSGGKIRVENEKAESVEEQEAEVNQKQIVLVTGTTMQPNNESEDEHKQEEQNEGVLNGQHDYLTNKIESEEEEEEKGDNEEHKNSGIVTFELQENKVPLKQRLRSSCKEQEQTPINKKQVEPVRRILRSGKAISETPEVSRSSKRKPKIETEQVSSSRKTRRTGL